MNSPDFLRFDWDATEVRRLRVQTALDANRSKPERNKLGQFPTPPALARGMAQVLKRFLKPEQRVHFADPTFGTGAFFTATLMALGQEHLCSAQGIELDAGLVALARELWQDAPLQLFEGDFTNPLVRKEAAFQVAAPNFVLANPPYVRHHHLSVEEKTRLKTLVAGETGQRVSGLSGLYIYCLLLSLRWMAPGGLAAWLVPAEWLDVNYGEALKTALLHNVELLRVHRFDPQGVLFDEALVSSTVIFFRNAPPNPTQSIEFSSGADIEAPVAQRLLAPQTLRAEPRWSGLFDAKKAGNFTSIAVCEENEVGNSEAFSLLGDLFTIRRGIATGANEFFILARDEARRRNLSPDWLRPILPSPKSLRQSIIADSGDGYPALDGDKVLCLLDCALSPSVVERDHPPLWDYLQEGSAQGYDQRYLTSTRSPWYRQEKRAPAPFLCTYMGRGGASSGAPLRFLWNRSQSVASNLYLMLYPREALASWLQEDAGRFKQMFGWLQKLECSALTDGGRVYGGGLHKIEPKELSNVLLQVPQGAFEVRDSQLQMKWK